LGANFGGGASTPPTKKERCVGRKLKIRGRKDMRVLTQRSSLGEKSMGSLGRRKTVIRLIPCDSFVEEGSIEKGEKTAATI